MSRNVFVRIFRFYRDGFREMTSLGRTLWAVILVKLFIMFAILRLFLFPDVMGKFDTDRERSEYMMERLLNTNH